jgi:hypothetical protein
MYRSLAVRLLLASSLLLVAGCNDDEPTRPAPAPSRSSSPVPPIKPDPTANAEAIVRDPEVLLSGFRIRRSGSHYDVTSLWRRPGAGQAALVRSDDGFATATYTLGRYNALWDDVVPPRPANAPDHTSCAQIKGGIDACGGLRRGDGFPVDWTADNGSTWTHLVAPAPRMLGGPETSLRPRTIAAVRGGDGATLLPFQLALRSDDLGETWRSFDLPKFDGEGAFVAGSVVTSDGRLLSLLNNFTGDRINRPSGAYHGMYVSAGADWSSYSELQPRFSPPLTAAPAGWSPLVRLGAEVAPDPVVFVSTWDNRVYVSTDEAKSFRVIAVR